MTPFTDHQEMPRIFHEAILYERLRAMGIKVRDVHFPQGGGSLSVIIQVEPHIDGQVTDALLAVLGLALAEHQDGDRRGSRHRHLRLSRRALRPGHAASIPAAHVITIGNARGFIFDPSASRCSRPLPTRAEPRFPSVVGKWGIDATKPVPYPRRRTAKLRARLADRLGRREIGRL